MKSRDMLVPGLLVLCAGMAAAAELSVDFTQVVGRVRPALHSASFGGQLTGGYSAKAQKMLEPLHLHAARTHDWALVNADQRICDTHFDPKRPTGTRPPGWSRQGTTWSSTPAACSASSRG